VTRNRGFTLIELLIAMSLFVVLSTALIALLTQAFTFLTAGNQGSEVSDRTNDFLHPFQADLDNLLVERSLDPGIPMVRLFSDYVQWDATGNRSPDQWVQRLIFVRSTRDETAYMAVPTDVNDPGLMTLYRATRSPQGGTKKSPSLFDTKIRNLEQLEKIAEPLVTGVLYFGVRFWSATTKRWDSDFARPSSAGPSLSWDSTRGILPSGLQPNEFFFALGRESLTDPRDDISPRMVRVAFVFERTGKDREIARLIAGIDSGARKVPVSDAGFATTSKEHHFIKVGTEWMSYANVGSEGFRVVQRGARGTVPMSHKEGEIVRAGYTVERVIELPSFRDDFNFR